MESRVSSGELGDDQAQRRQPDPSQDGEEKGEGAEGGPFTDRLNALSRGHSTCFAALAPLPCLTSLATVVEAGAKRRDDERDRD